jgi:hypothetical protein
LDKGGMFEVRQTEVASGHCEVTVLGPMFRRVAKENNGRHCRTFLATFQN